MMADSTKGAKPTPALALGQRFEVCYRHIHATAMTDVPICNPALTVAATGFRTYHGRAFGIVTTPWFMNLVAVDLPDGAPSAPAATGTTLSIGLPAGEVEFIAGRLDAIGRVDSCALLSPLFEFATMEAALEMAEEAARAFFDPAMLEPASEPLGVVNRRDVLRGHFSRREEALQ
ncbi:MULTISPECIES: [NiFe]-hydrogenase assembly chaperone HybE [unclassified Sinorhizobium]|uniref:[NiFe]-hydrogenase assembly chaperone HybE n=1 Tax=unclassified Sinorhizobium TaxID=2613772 RepID=UPI0024C22AE2|nr:MULTISPECIES: [NiFe]-hydrogenase assembly chaperone HybE [unclassified Sinorhizobium]MDK1376549.1 [NiFe]-hydrogenase assembly chaperone HybE [Sinorhizobium sp. 6-70]MDK1481518.1 [NiFe]-hydrogenase assembly chaperone HybE [Sinorhizobium sp. 6-117]